MELHLVNPDPHYQKADLIEPTTRGYLLVEAAVRPGLGPLPIVAPSIRRYRVLERLKRRVSDLMQVDGVEKVSLFRAIVMPPTARFSAYLKERGHSVQVANFDVIALIETTSPEKMENVRTSPAFRSLVEALQRKATTVRITEARNIRRIDDVDTTRQGLFLFNHFAADDPTVMLDLWDYLAGWYEVETGLENSVALTPLDSKQSDYAIINWARWDEHPLKHFWHQLSKRSFWNYVTANLEANCAASMPIYCRLA